MAMIPVAMYKGKKGENFENFKKYHPAFANLKNSKQLRMLYQLNFIAEQLNVIKKVVFYKFELKYKSLFSYAILLNSYYLFQ